MADANIVVVTIETAIRPVSALTAQVGQKSLQTITIDFKTKVASEKFATGVTHLFGRTLHSVRNDFKFFDIRFGPGGQVSFSVKGQTASGVGFMPNIDYKFDIMVIQSAKEIIFSGSHDGYPSYNISVNGAMVYDYVQGWIGQLLGTSDVIVARKTVSWK